jgi:competence CoiA-like predicted nuclease
MPYFRHKEKDKCEDVYSEPETEEHIKGKRDLFEWVKVQDNVTDAVLEGWIPETHQRPDIMFKYNDEQYVIEYQCTPIASEYVKRHYLYKAADIKDIWILGYDNYRTNRIKMIEKFAIAYYSTGDNDFNFIQLHYKTHNIVTINDIIERYKRSKNQLEEYLEQQEIIKNCNQYIKAHYTNITNELNKYGYNFIFVYVDKKTSYYTSKMYCNFKNKDINDLTFFIKPNSFDVCYFNGYNYIKLESVKYNTFDIEAFKKIVLMIALRYKNNKIKTEE